jgi:hypothetical protein
MNAPMVHAAEVIAAYGGGAEEMVRRRDEQFPTIAMSLSALAEGGHASLIGASLSRSGTWIRSPTADGPRHYAMFNQRRLPD